MAAPSGGEAAATPANPLGRHLGARVGAVWLCSDGASCAGARGAVPGTDHSACGLMIDVRILSSWTELISLRAQQGKMLVRYCELVLRTLLFRAVLRR